jgi:hypothetical protein
MTTTTFASYMYYRRATIERHEFLQIDAPAVALGSRGYAAGNEDGPGKDMPLERH